MGLLDDAIREHLDLKRARGGDPAEIERMEREALGPVRREPTFGTTRFPDDEPAAHSPGRAEYLDDHGDGEYGGYRDSTAPHDEAHPSLHDEFDHDREDPFEPTQKRPRRRFLRRNRASSFSDEAPRHPRFEEDEPHLGGYDEWPHADDTPPEDSFHGGHDPAQGEAHVELPYAEPLPSQEAPGSAEDVWADGGPSADPAHVERDDAPGHEEPPTQAMPLPEPPHLRFEQPPKRPRFTAEPPSPHSPDELDEPEVSEPSAAAPAAAAPPPTDDRSQAPLEAQETTEFDVASHIEGTRPEPEEPPLDDAPAPADAPDRPTATDAAAEEDVLEETPEFLQDTPEHDRLWFEQRPPRDFDF